MDEFRWTDGYDHWEDGVSRLISCILSGLSFGVLNINFSCGCSSKLAFLLGAVQDVFG